ncbi:mobilome CxxCx(11)CxxC protein [Bradyrhizobium sp. STM 3561]|uniref:mobilome CxxCx(11)CxxC protein n=1 Tax=unclassified Bradyrhizobium TaxID=2631580 RepID=UPI00388D3DD4
MATPDEIRQEAWTQFINARGTSTVFQRRAAKLKRWMQARDFSAVAIPVITAFVATTDFVDKLGSFKAIALGVLAFAVLMQVLLSAWSLIARWDEERSYSLRALRDANDMEVNWREIAKNLVAGDIEEAFEFARSQQKVIDSHDIGKEISEDERRIGLRAGLKEVPRPCVECKKIPATIDVPKHVVKPCPVCGGEL